MANTVTLELFKAHARADDFATDDVILQHYLDAAEETVIKATNRTETELTTLNGGTFPMMLKQAIMMLADYWYDQREDASTVNVQDVPNGAKSLIKPWRKLVNETVTEDESGTDDV